MNDAIQQVREGKSGALMLGIHPGILQSVLDFDYLCGKEEPSLVAIVTGARSAQKCFFGSREVLIPCFPDLASIPADVQKRVHWMLNAQSGRRAYESTVQFFETFPHALGGVLFAENVPERHATELIRRFGETKTIAGPASVGFLVPGHLKLGAIGGTTPAQIAQGGLAEEGSVAVVSTSGGMTNELITSVAKAGHRISFSLAIGGDRFPVTSLGQVLEMAQRDPQTKAVVYFGELGGTDEYEIAQLLKDKKLTKRVVAYIAGSIDEGFSERMQFGHAKALAQSADESASAKRKALNDAGAIAPDSFKEFLAAIAALPRQSVREKKYDTTLLMKRQGSILSTREIVDLESVPEFVKAGKLVKQGEYALTTRIVTALLDKEPSETFAAFVENVFELLLDHGGAVSGAVNTMVTARAGQPMAVALSSGLLTVGPRFGGAVTQAAEQWRRGVQSDTSVESFIKDRTKGGALLAGIGHRKYRVGLPDPRVESLSGFAKLLKQHPHYDYARAIESEMTKKSGNLILNVDGVVAALALDMLVECEKFSPQEIDGLIQAEFFNALFIIPRTVGFIAHFMEQKLHDEGLFRLPEELLYVKPHTKAGATKKRK